MTPILQLTGVGKRFGGLRAVRDLSLAMRPGEVVGLLGPNGSGKTTALNMISGALAPSEGEIRLSGRVISGLKPHRIAGMGVARTFQLVRILPSLTVAGNVEAALAFGRKKHWGAELHRLAEEMLERVGLAGRGDAPAADLTYIDQKRLELARALASEPSLLLLDEWLAGLNPTELQEGIATIRALEASNVAILLVEHIMEAVHALCPRVVVMNAGEVIADGSTREVLRQQAVIDAYLGEAHA